MLSQILNPSASLVPNGAFYMSAINDHIFFQSEARKNLFDDQSCLCMIESFSNARKL